MVATNAVNNETSDNDMGTCAHTTEGNTTNPAWWQVDLGDAYRITGIKIYNRKKEGKQYVLAMHVKAVRAQLVYCVSFCVFVDAACFFFICLGLICKWLTQ